MPDIMHLVKIHASPERVYEALTTPEGIRNWWTRDAVLDSKIGGTCEFRFYEGTSVTKITVDELKPAVRVGWKTISSFRPEWGGTTITFDLRAQGSDTVLSFAHRRLQASRRSLRAYDDGLGLLSRQLATVSGDGKRRAHPDIEFARVIR